jgi:hypothetical protein
MPLKIAALLPFRNEMRYLPSWFESVSTNVDGVIALDDRSTDGSFEYVAAQPQVLSIQKIKEHPCGIWNEPRNRRLLIVAGQELGFDWFVAFDADERVETRFWPQSRRIGAQALASGIHAFHFPLRELWDSPRRFRVDGIWSCKKKAVFFSNLGLQHVFDSAAWHGDWASLGPDGFVQSQPLLYNLYHLKMIREVDRRARRDRYNSLDPHREFQPIGYDYLTNVDGLELAEIPHGQDYAGVPEFLLEPGL